MPALPALKSAPLNFVLDTGASEVNIPADVALTLYRAGTIRDTDFLPGRTYRLADGSLENNARFVLRHLKIGQRGRSYVLGEGWSCT
jgi:hypothetical protein